MKTGVLLVASKYNRPIKISNGGFDFLFDLQTNLRLSLKSKQCKRTEIGMGRSVDLITKYFKMNNTRYLELIKLYEDEA
jgi:hypothetical protein